MQASRLLYCYKISFYLMNYGSGSQSDDSVMSPAAFIAGLQPLSNAYDRPQKHKNEQNREAHSEKYTKFSLLEGTKSSEKSQKKRIAGLKSRQKKRKELQEMEESVNQLAAKIEQVDRQLSKCKDELVEAVKLSTHSSSEHGFTFSQLQKLITAQDVDLDQINLLLDIIQSRIGANGKERQSKLEYNFKQIINSLFPAMHRYLMFTAVYHKDIFAEEREGIESFEKWTRILYEETSIPKQILDEIAKRKSYFIKKRCQTIELISKLKKVKNELKNQQQIVQNVMSQCRLDMTPIQSSQLILFGQKNKLRRQFLFLDQIFVWQNSPAKQIKKQQ